MKNKIEILKSIRKIYKKSVDKTDSVFSYLTNWAFRDITNSKPVKYVSEEALKMAKQKGINLSKMNYKDLKKIDPNKEWLYYEHFNTVKDLRLAILNTNESIEKIVNRAMICWITREEQARLDKKYKDHREDCFACFKEMNIKVLENKGDLYV